MRARPFLTEPQFDKEFGRLRESICSANSKGLTADQEAMLRKDWLPTVLLPYQLDWERDQSDYKIAEKSRRIGISFTNALDDVIHAAAQNGGDCFYLSYNKDMTRTYIDDCKFWIKKISGEVPEVKEITNNDDKDFLAFQVRFSSGFSITALSGNPANLRSKGRPNNRVTIDESAHIKPPNTLYDLLTAAGAFLAWMGRIRIIGTHNGEDSQFNELINDVRAGKISGSVHRTTLREAVRQGLYKKICEITGVKWTKDGAEAWIKNLYEKSKNPDEEYGVIPSQGTGAVLSRAIIERCMSEELPVLRLARKDDFKLKPELYRETDIDDWLTDNIRSLLRQLDKDRRTYLGLDFARSGDLSVLCIGQDAENCALRIPLIIEMRNIPHTSQWQVCRCIIERLPLFTHGAFDARGNGSYLAEIAQQQYGEGIITEVMPTEKWYREEMPHYIAKFEDGNITLPKDGGVLDDHRCLQKIKGVIRLPATQAKDAKDGGKRHGDAAFAGALCEFASRQEVFVEFDFESTGIECASSEDIF